MAKRKQSISWIVAYYAVVKLLLSARFTKHSDIGGKDSANSLPILDSVVPVHSKEMGSLEARKWAASRQYQQNDKAPSKDSEQPGHSPSLIRIFAVHMMKAWTLSYPLSAQWRLWSDWADAQADLSLAQSDLSLRWAHMPFCRFCHEAAQMTSSWVAVYEHPLADLSAE